MERDLSRLGEKLVKEMEFVFTNGAFQNRRKPILP